jgi:hypothetical protein
MALMTQPRSAPCLPRLSRLYSDLSSEIKFLFVDMWRSFPFVGGYFLIASATLRVNQFQQFLVEGAFPVLDAGADTTGSQTRMPDVISRHNNLHPYGWSRSIGVLTIG